MALSTGGQLYKWVVDLFPICRSIAGPGQKLTLQYIKHYLPNLTVHGVKTGRKFYDWVVPQEWAISDAYISDLAGNRIVDFRENNLHVVGYSEPVNEVITFLELNKKLHSIPDMPTAIPYRTSYYKRDWGFCIQDSLRKKMKDDRYKVVIDSKFYDGELNYGEVIIKGATDKEIFLSTYICHPSMANNELSGPAVMMGIVQWLNSLHYRKFTYRCIFIPETIGSIIYINKNLKKLKKNVIAGFNLNCLGDRGGFSFLASRYGNTLADRVCKSVLNNRCQTYKSYSFLDRGSDERQYCSPGVDLPVASIMRSKFGTYDEYHTSLDNLDFIDPDALYESLDIYIEMLKILELNKYYQAQYLCEPQMGKRGLYPTISEGSHDVQTMNYMNILAYCDGTNDLINLSSIIGLPTLEIAGIINTLEKHGLVYAVDD